MNQEPMSVVEQRKAHREAHKEHAVYDMQAGDALTVVAMRYGIHPKWLRVWKREAA